MSPAADSPPESIKKRLKDDGEKKGINWGKKDTKGSLKMVLLNRSEKVNIFKEIKQNLFFPHFEFELSFIALIC